MPEPNSPDREARPAGRRRKGLLVAGALVLLLLGIPLVGVYEKTWETGPTEAAKSAPGDPKVIQVRATTGGVRTGNIHYVLSLDQEVLVDARSPDKWLLQLMNELEKQNIDPRAKALMNELEKQNIDPRAKALMDELGKQQSIDPRAKVTLDSVVYDSVKEKKNYERRKELLQKQQAINAERVRLEALPDSSSQKSIELEKLEKNQTSLTEEADELLKNRRDLA
jgi:hypothetical protein